MFFLHPKLRERTYSSKVRLDSQSSKVKDDSREAKLATSASGEEITDVATLGRRLESKVAHQSDCQSYTRNFTDIAVLLTLGVTDAEIISYLNVRIGRKIPGGCKKVALHMIQCSPHQKPLSLLCPLSCDCLSIFVFTSYKVVAHSYIETSFKSKRMHRFDLLCKMDGINLLSFR